MIYGAVLALALIGVWLAEHPDGRPDSPRARARGEGDPVGGPRPVETSRIPALDLERLTLRAQGETAADPFRARAWEALAAEEARRSAPPPGPPRPPVAPPLPFTFMGKLVDAGQATVFLTNGTRNWVVRTGDTIDGAYRVDSIGDERMTLTYLALQLRQELAIGEGIAHTEARSTASTSEALPVADAPRASAQPLQIPLLFAAPSRVTAGNELVVSVALPPGGARAAKVELAYDAKVLAAINGPPGGGGRMTVELGGAIALAQVRFRVIAPGPTTTHIGVETSTATDARGARPAMASPGTHSVQIVPAGG